MPRYIKQRHERSCGPTALMNAVKWAGYSLSYEDYIDYYAKLCDYKKGDDFGTHWLNLHRAILATPELKLVALLNRPTLRQLDRFLNKGFSAIVRYKHSKGGHFAFVPKHTAKFYYMVNGPRSKATLCRISRKDISKKLRYVDLQGETSKIWILEAAQ